jgi:putative SOS response-associated peptidase YedK
MCGRAKLASDYADIRRKLKIGDRAPPNPQASWNIAPTQDMLCVVYDAAMRERVAVKMHWGLIPRWSKDSKLKFPTFNARADTLADKATFRDAWKAGRRCLVVTDGFYEWRKGDKQPFAIACVNDDLTVMAGLWEAWKGPTGETITSCTIITTEANALLRPIHDRMPCILAEEHWPMWLGEVPASAADVKALLAPFPSRDMHLWPVSKRVGNVRNNDPSLAAEIAMEPEGMKL